MANDVNEVDNLKKVLGEPIAFNDANFTVKHGEILGFLGSNGAAKTTRSIASRLNKNETKKRELG
jgi:ABC-type multidrug transport system ATPase subunit